MKRGGPLRRKTPLKRGGLLVRHSPIRRKYARRNGFNALARPLASALGFNFETGAERAARRKAERYLSRYAGPFDGFDCGEFVRQRGCLLVLLGPHTQHRCHGDVAAAHVLAQSVGGTWKDLVGLCVVAHHDLDENCGNRAGSFEAKHGVDLRREADSMAGNAEEFAAGWPGRWDTERARKIRREYGKG